MKILFIKRTSPTTGQVYSLFPFCDERPITRNLPFQEAKEYLDQHQADLKVYKVGITHKGEKRKLYKRILATDEHDAIGLYQRLLVYEITEKKDVTYELLTGDWKPVHNIKTIF